MKLKKKPLILIAEDDEDDFLMAKEAFLNACPECEIRWVENGEQMMDYLLRRGEFKDSPRPHLILMDLNMPRKDGREVLRDIRAQQDLAPIPVIAMTTSARPDDTQFCYQHGANSVILKPVGFNQLVKAFQAISRYWFDTVQLPDFLI